MTNILDRAREVQRKVAGDTNVWIKLAFLQDMIAEIERLEGVRPPLRVIADKLKERTDHD